MKSGEVSLTPEIEVAYKGKKRKAGTVDIGVQDEEEVEVKAVEVAEPSKKKQKKSKIAPEVTPISVDAEDDFFE